MKLKVARRILVKIFGEKITAWIHGLRFLYLISRYPLPDPEVKFLAKFDLSNSVAIDVGANGANWTFELSKVVGIHGKVLAFEPHPYYFSATLNAIKLSGRDNILLFQSAISSKDKLLKLEIANDNDDLAGLSKLVPIEDGSRGSVVVDVLAVTLDSLEEQYDKPISVIKIDVEGHEVEVLIGSINILSTHRPIVIFELNRNNHSMDLFSQAKKIFDSLDYGIYYLSDQLQPIVCSEYYELPNVESLNLVALHPDWHSTLRTQ